MENKEEEVHEITPFDPTKKKKKKKVVIQDLTEEAEKPAEKSEEPPAGEGAELTFFGMKKKKKKQVDMTFIHDEEENKEASETGEDEEGQGSLSPWEGSDRDYTYDELLGRAFNKQREDNQDLAGDRRRTFMLWPKVYREGTKRSVFVNFMSHCMMMRRQPEHVMAFLLTELGTSGSLNGQQSLVVKGRFPSKYFASILRRYTTEYVICNGCKSPDTILSKENRLFFLRCEQCGSSYTVMPIKAGYVARVGPRKD